MHKLKLIIQREFLAKVKNKSFIVMTILSPLLIVGLIMLIVFLNQKNTENTITVAYVDESGLLNEVFEDTAHTKYVDLTDLGLDEAKTQTRSLYYGLVHVPESEDLDSLSYGIAFYAEDSPSFNVLNSLERKLENRIRDLKILALNVDIDVLNSTNTKVDLQTENFDGERSSKAGSILKMVMGGVFGYLIFMFILIYGTSVMRSVIEEKTSRIIEIIISSVKPFQLMLGKILGNAFAGVLQFVIWIISAGVLLFVISAIFGPEVVDTSAVNGQVSQEMIDEVAATANNELEIILAEVANLPILTMVVSFIIYFFGGYLIYSSIFAAIGAAVDSETDTQQFMMPVLIPMMIAIYVGFTVIENPHGPIAVGFSMFPLTSPIVMLMRIPFDVPWEQLLLSIVILIASFFGIVWFAAKIYRIGILMYGKRPTYKELYKWLKY